MRDYSKRHVLIYIFAIVLIIGITLFVLNSLSLTNGFSDLRFEAISFLPVMSAISIILLILGSIGLVILGKNELIIRRSEKMEIELENGRIMPGETLNGCVHLELRKPTRAKALKVAFVGEKDISHQSDNGSSERSYYFHKEEVILHGESEYWHETFPFKIWIPFDILEKAERFGKKNIPKETRELLKKVESMGLTRFNEKNKWYIEANIETFNGREIKDKKEMRIQNN